MKKKVLLSNCLVIVFLFLTIGTKAQTADGEMMLNEFRLVQQQNRILLKWVADKKFETKYFEVEKSVDGKKYKTVAYVLGADPVQKEGNSFLCFDKVSKPATKIYYRLKQINENGDVQYSQTKILALK